MFPVLWCKGFGENVSHLRLGIHVLNVNVRVLELLIRASEVDFVGATDVPHPGAAALLDDLNGGVVVLHDFEVHRSSKNLAPQLQGGQRLSEEAVREADEFSLSG